MRAMMRKIMLFLVAALISTALAIPSFAADLSWFVLQDSKGRCSVRQMKDKSPKTIAGPYATKEAATKAKAEKCPKTEKKK
jgi:hypothetical protein